MGTTLHINLNALDEAFIEELRKRLGAAEVEIHLPETPEDWLTEEGFWHLIDRLDWSKRGDDEAVIEPVVQALAEMPAANIHQFEDILTEKLWLLDTRQHAAACIRDKESDYLSADGFLYDRCCVLANGKAFFEAVLNDPSKFPTGLSFERLLSIASKAHERKTGKAFMFIPRKSYETYSNESGWEN
jgi:hypothetical protein